MSENFKIRKPELNKDLPRTYTFSKTQQQIHGNPQKLILIRIIWMHNLKQNTLCVIKNAMT